MALLIEVSDVLTLYANKRTIGPVVHEFEKNNNCTQFNDVLVSLYLRAAKSFLLEAQG